MTQPVTRVSSRSELEAHLRARPRCLRAMKAGRGPRVGHPEFIGPFNPTILERCGALYFRDGVAWMDLAGSPRQTALAIELQREGLLQ